MNRIWLGIILFSLWGSSEAVQLDFTWTASTSPEVNSYRIKYGTSTGSYGTTITTGNVTSYNYNFNPGYTYYFILTASDGTNESTPTAEISQAIPLSPTIAVSNLSNFCTAPCTINFLGSTNYNTAATSWAWTFGDGTTSTSQNPSKVYASPGVYTVSLTVGSAGGSSTVTFNDYVAVKTATQTTGLVLAYGFEQQSSNNSVVDASGNGNTGTLSGVTRVSGGRFGKAVSFNGTSSYISAADSLSLDVSSGMTLSAWVKPTSTMSGIRTIIQKEDPVNSTVYRFFANTASNVPLVGGFINSVQRTLSGTSQIPANKWTYLTGTYDGSNLKLFIDGNQKAIASYSGTISSSTGLLRIGGDSGYFSGVIDEVRVYSKALTRDEVRIDMRTAIGQ